MFHQGTALQSKEILKKYQFLILCNLGTKCQRDKIKRHI